MSILIFIKEMPFAGPAVRFGGLIAQLSDTSATLLQVVSGEDKTEAVERCFMDAVALLEDIPIERRVRKGEAIENILAEIREGDYEMVVLRARSAIRYRQRLRKKIGRAIAVESPIPVLIVKNNPKENRLNKILVCTGGKDVSIPVVQKGAVLARHSDASVTLLHITPPVPSMYTGMDEIEETFKELLQTDTPTARHLRKAASHFAEQDIDARLEIRQGDVTEEILAECEAGDYDLVIIGAPSRDNRLKEWLMGDVTRGLVNLANQAVLIVR